MKDKLTTKEIVVIGLSATLMGVFSQLSIPIPTVPLTLQVFGAVIIAIILGGKLATFAMIIYTLVGAIGIPVFANFSRGLSVLVGPTGGYITGFIILAFIVGKAAEKRNRVILVAGAYLGLIAEYALGTVQLKMVLDMSIQEALIAGVYPFIIKDLILTGVAIVVGIKIKTQLRGILDGRIKA